MKRRIIHDYKEFECYAKMTASNYISYTVLMAIYPIEGYEAYIERDEDGDKYLVLEDGDGDVMYRLLVKQ